ncbi:DUF2470 domain-containing protein [Gordonia jinhuaensis]|uniref:Prephenate dehydratase n=1 Tax=Gordonia jinhuaensis TaxID=1517702 RepID=A0A916TFP2_9ACTN|nr:DUF2470 domain-containing protein [Gordonia jinhuaensis]GGB43195.1 prephenate dehydratase [Gordonia jinhuaensis]
MTTAHALAPTPAEAVRTACMRATDATLAVDDPAGDRAPEPMQITMVHLYETQAFVLVPNSRARELDAAADPAGLQAMVEITDCAPIPLREPVRALIWLNGRLHAVPRDLQHDLAVEISLDHPQPHLLDVGHTHTLLRMQLGHAVIANGAGAASATAAELAIATPDPFWEFEDHWVAHLDHDHSDLVGVLARHLSDEERHGRIRPLGIDRYGIRLRVEGPGPDTDIRLPFNRPVGDVVELSGALRSLVGCPYLNSIPHSH